LFLAAQSDAVDQAARIYPNGGIKVYSVWNYAYYDDPDLRLFYFWMGDMESTDALIKEFITGNFNNVATAKSLGVTNGINIYKLDNTSGLSAAQRWQRLN
jgi:hypothetical protein